MRRCSTRSYGHASSRRNAPDATSFGCRDPLTPAGAALRAWLDAFNSGDSTRMAAYTRTCELTLARGAGFVFCQQPRRPFDLLSIERNEPRHVEFVLRDSLNEMSATA